MTRSGLFDDVQAYTRRTDSDFTTRLSTMLRHVEARIAREIVHSSQVTVTTLALSGRTVTVPTDCLEVRSVSVQEGPVLDWVTPEVLREGRLWDGSGDPCQYTLEGRDIYVAPAGTATLDLSYYARFTAMSADSDTTALLTSDPDLYLFAMLHEAGKFIQDKDYALEMNAQYVDVKRQVLAQDLDYQASGSVARRISQASIV
jgi:hypothetical protein